MPRLPRLPDLLTTANLCCGVVAILLASQGQLTIACGLVFLAAVFDVLDGLAARALGQGGSELGKQLDSLADMVSFGVAPGVIAAVLPKWMSGELLSGRLVPLLASEMPLNIGGGAIPRYISDLALGSSYAIIPPLIIVIASAWRLAKFNIDARQVSGFLGLPTPANALFWASIPLALNERLVANGPGASELQFRLIALSSAELLSLVALGLGILMLSELPLPSLKFKHFHWKGNEVIYLLIGIGAVLVALYGVLAVPLILILYLLSPLWGKLFPKTIEPQRRNDATP